MWSIICQYCVLGVLKRSDVTSGKQKEQLSMHKPTCKISSLKQTSTQCAAMLWNNNQTEHIISSQVVDLNTEYSKLIPRLHTFLVHMQVATHVPEAPTDVNLHLTSG